MNKHILIDRLTAATGALLAGKHRYFSRSIDSPTLLETAAGLRIEPPELAAPGRRELVVSTPVGDADPAYEVVQWAGEGKPALIFHHGNNERPYDYRRTAKNTFRGLFPNAGALPGVTLINLRAPFHNGTLGQYMRTIGSLQAFVTMIAVSTALVEALVTDLRRRGSPHVAVSGISLGGWVANLHRAVFDSASCYVPIFAGAALSGVFLDSEYSRLTAPEALGQAQTLCRVLDFEERFRRVPDRNVFPLLARHDQFVRFDRQSLSYDGHPVEAIEAGHVTGSLSHAELRRHLDCHIGGRIDGECGCPGGTGATAGPRGGNL